MSRTEELERIGRERIVAERLAASDRRRDFLRTILQCLGFCLLGLAIMFLGFYVTDLQIGRALLYFGIAVGYAGMTHALLTAYIRGERRGDW